MVRVPGGLLPRAGPQQRKIQSTPGGGDRQGHDGAAATGLDAAPLISGAAMARPPRADASAAESCLTAASFASCGHAGALRILSGSSDSEPLKPRASRPEAPGARLVLEPDGDVVGVALRSGRLRVPINHSASDVRNAPDSARKRTLPDFACGSKCEIPAASKCFPLCPHKRTSTGTNVVSEKCHRLT
jgi:hypothetical protein